MAAQPVFTLRCFVLAVLLAVTTGAQKNGEEPEAFSNSSTCSAFDTSRDITDYSARLVALEGANYEIQIQAVHAKGMASPIKKITLGDGSAPTFEMLEDNCVCGMRINDVDVECTHITTYVAAITQEILEASADSGLAMTFLLENGRIIAGPLFGPEEIRKTLGRN